MSTPSPQHVQYKSITLSEVKKHNKSNSVWVVIHDSVYDVTSFLSEHPGGADALLDVAGTDGTQPFEDVGHSQDARDLLAKYKIGHLPPGERKEASTCKVPCKLKYAAIALAGALIIGIVVKKYVMTS